MPSHLQTWSMSSSMRAMSRLPAASIGLRIATRRQFATSPQSFVTRARPSSRVHGDKSKLYTTFRRTYADVAPANKPRRFRFFTYLWRLTYLSAIAGTAYLAYGVYDLRHPDEQFEPDPAKKNLVILGMYPELSFVYSYLTSSKVLDGVLYLCSRSLTLRITMSLSSLLETISSSHHSFHHVRRVLSSIDQSWNLFEA